MIGFKIDTGRLDGLNSRLLLMTIFLALLHPLRLYSVDFRNTLLSLSDKVFDG